MIEINLKFKDMDELSSFITTFDCGFFYVKDNFAIYYDFGAEEYTKAGVRIKKQLVDQWKALKAEVENDGR